MAVISITSEIRHGRLRIFVTADKGSHHSTLAKAVWQYVKEQAKPEYEGKPGQWCLPRFDGYWQATGQDIFTSSKLRKTFTSWPVPSNSEDRADRK